MKKAIFSAVLLILLIILAVPASAEDEAYIIGGGGAAGQGTNDNGWLISSPGGGYTYDAEGLRVYLVDSGSGRPVSGMKIIDITNAAVSKENTLNGNKRTKHDYRFVNSSLSLVKSYTYETVSADKRYA